MSEQNERGFLGNTLSPKTRQGFSLVCLDCYCLHFSTCSVAKIHVNFSISGAQAEKSRLHRWKDVNAGDIKVFLAHVIAMGLCRKSRMDKYWTCSKTIGTPFFGKYMSKNVFQLLLSNIHLANDEDNPRKGRPGHDPLHKVRPFVDMCDKNFATVYRPEKEISFDEGCCPFKGRLSFKVYSPQKPNKFAIRLFQACEASSGYISAFEIYTGKNTKSCADNAPVIDPSCTRTTKLVVGLLDKVDLLNTGRHIYMDNYYSSPELMMELFDKKTYATGTVRVNRKGLPEALGKDIKLQKGETAFRRNGPLLALKWRDKRCVYMISTIHSAYMVSTGRVDYRNNIISKPEPIFFYIKLMGGVDLGDQMLSYYSFLRRSVKWWRKLWVHMLNMVLLNAFILQKKYSTDPLQHEAFREYIVEMLLKEGLENCALPLPAQASSRAVNASRLSERHFPSFIPKKFDAKRAKPTRPCYLCSQVKEVLGVVIRPRWSSYWCGECRKVLCVDSCFQIYHTEEDCITATRNRIIAERAIPAPVDN